MKKKPFHRLEAAPLWRPLICVSLAILMTTLAAGTAQAVEGCNPKVREMQLAKAEAEKAKDNQRMKELIPQPESVTAMTCFNQSAGKSAKEGGNVFSGDFTDTLGPIVTTALNSYYDDFAGAIGFQDFAQNTLGINVSTLLGNTIGNGLSTFSQPPFNVNMSGLGTITNLFSGSTDIQGIIGTSANTVNYGTQLENTTDCNGIKNLWGKIHEQGVNTKIPQLSMADLMDPNFTLPSNLDNSVYKKEFEANKTNGVFSKLRTAVQNAPVPQTPTSFGTPKSECDVLFKAGIITTPCP